MAIRQWRPRQEVAVDQGRKTTKPDHPKELRRPRKEVVWVEAGQADPVPDDAGYTQSAK